MKPTHLKAILAILVIVISFYSLPVQAAMSKGIYLTQETVENTALLNYLIKRAKAVGINTFVADLEIPSKRYEHNIKLLKEAGIVYIARIIVFPGGASREQMESIPYREKKYRLVQKAIDYGALAIQLDYIRYNTQQRGSSQNAENVLKVINWFKNRLAAQDIPLQIDVFGIASFGESKYIGQNIKLFAKSVDVICPMVYPSHFEPYRYYAQRPYQIVYDSLNAIKDQFPNKNVPVKIIPYIELSNYRYPLSHSKKLDYIVAQIKATENGGADGWYVWSPHNLYDNLFQVLSNYHAK